MRTLSILFIVLISTAANAETLGGHARQMLKRGAIWHDRGARYRGEIVAHGSGAFPRLQARQMWRRSASHRPILVKGVAIRCARKNGRWACVGRR